MAELVLVLGGARSGKSAAAERLLREAEAAGAARGVVYVATARGGGDPELDERIAAHQARRPAHWTTVEGQDPAAAVAAAPLGAGVLVDGLGLWVAGRMDALGLLAPDGAAVADAEARRARMDAVVAEGAALAAAAGKHRGGPVVVVAEEAGMGVVAADAATRGWVDLHGSVVQALSAAAGRAFLVAAGRALPLPHPGVTWDARPRGRGRGQEPAVLDAAAGGLRAHGDTMVPDGALDLAVNVYGVRPPAHVRAAVVDAVDRGTAYPDAGGATAALAGRHGRAVGEVLVTAGAAEAFWLLAAAVRARDAVVVHPQFTEPEAALRAHGIPVRHLLRRPETGWALDPGAVGEDADLVVVGNPNNPTGTLDRAEAVAALCRPGRLTVVDEAFMDFVPDEAASLAHRGDLPGLVVVRSVTKLWGLAGVRAGYLLGPPGVVARLQGSRQPWPVSSPALAALTVCAGDETYRRRVAGRVAAERAALRRALAAIPGVAVWDGAANFVLVRVPDGPKVHAALLDRGIAVRPCTFPGLDADHLRVAVADEGSTRRLAAALADVLAAAGVARPAGPVGFSR